MAQTRNPEAPQAIATAPPQEPGEQPNGRIGTLSSVLGAPSQGMPDEVVVGEVTQQYPANTPADDIVRIRMGERTIDEMSVVSGGRRLVYQFDAGQVYDVPRSVAAELLSLNAAIIWR